MRASVFIVSFLFLSSAVVLCDISDADRNDIRLYAVMSAGSFEGVAVENISDNDVSLNDYSIYDGEGTIDLGTEITLCSGRTLYFLKSEPADWFAVERYVVWGNEGTSSKGFALNDSGDDVYLRYDGEIIDTFVYGNGTAKYGGWTGEPAEKMSRKQISVRNGQDTDTSDDWSIIVPGMTDKDTCSSNAEVIPFTFPESQGIPLMDELYNADESIYISIYLLSHPDIASIIIRALKRGVDVDILADGSPAGGMKDAEIKMLSTLYGYGADVKLLTTNEGYRRYTYLHSKYAVIDNESVILTSENWQESSFTSNRGWGAVIRSDVCAQYMSEVFRDDFEASDTAVFSDIYDNRTVCEYGEYVQSGISYPSYEANVTMCVSPDNTYEAMRQLISDADERIYIEQLTVSETWTIDGDNPVAWLSESEVTDVRVLLDGTFDDDAEGNYKAAENLNSDGNISAKVDDTGVLIHNKGVIADHSVWLGSVNWTDTSFCENREAAAIINSEEVSDYFAVYFLSDWGEKLSFDGEDSISIDCEENICVGRAFTISAYCSCVPDNAVYSWDTDSDGISDRIGERIVLMLSEGEHIVELFVNYGGMIYHKGLTITVGPGSDANIDIDWKYVPLIVLCVIIITYNIIKKKRDGDGTNKRNAHRGR